MVNKLTAYNLFGLWNIDPKETIFNELTELFPQESKWFSDVKLKSQSEQPRIIDEEEFNMEIVSNYEQAIKIWQDYQDDKELNCSIELEQLYKDIGEYYGDAIHDYKMAEKYYNLAVGHYLSVLEKENSDYEKMKIYNDMSIVFQLKMKPMMN
ncbi:unnamed protein product [Rotaria sp. Silwood2]|nr:unnamed protein product [Rotaria sp. Silwood2]CAF4709446.1 unnamed protein product [Rotaria sp. Silwood2]